MTIEQLAKEYEHQYKILCAKIEGLRPLLCVYTSNDLVLLRRKIKTYYDMALECKRTAALLAGYYDYEEEM